MRYPKITLEQFFYLLAFAIAAWLRFLFLGREALSDPEASLALQALGLARGNGVVLGPNPGYVLPTALLDFFFGATNFTARFWPALCGLLLILAVYLLREHLGRSAAVVLAFWIALDPGFNAVSRQVGSGAIGLTFCLLALASWVERKAVWTGIWAGLAILGGPLVWPNLLALGAAVLLTRVRKQEGTFLSSPFNWRTAGMSFLASALLFGTVLFLIPGGLSGAAASIPAYFQGWGAPSGVPILQMLAGLFFYEFLGFVLALAGLIYGVIVAKNQLDKFLAIWWGFALALTLVYPARQVQDLVWTLIPMLLLASRQIPRMLNIEKSERLATLGQALLILLLLVLITNLAISWPNVETSSLGPTYRYAVIMISALLIVAETTLVAWGWSRRVGLLGLAWGVLGLLFFLTISSLNNVAGFSGRAPAELWRSGPAFVEADLFVQTIKNYSQWFPDPTQAPEIVVLDLPSPAVEWILRDFTKLKVSSTVDSAATPSLLVTTDRSQLGLAAQYTGQAFIMAQTPSWDQIAPSEWAPWLIYRQLKKETWTTTNLILWVRSDLFPGATSKNNSGNP